MSKTLKIIILVTGIIALAIVFFYFKGQEAVAKGIKSCVDVPPDVQRWQGDMAADWGAYGPAKRKYLGIQDLEGEESNHVDGFFKAIDAQPNSKLVRTYSSEIKAWLNSGRADYHWMINKGERRCNYDVKPA